LDKGAGGLKRITMSKSHYNKRLKPLARKLRTHGTPGEAILWTHVLRARRFYGLQFNRQFPIENYIVDFICRKEKLILELDGRSHDNKKDQDRIRDLRLNELGYRVVRIAESDVMYDQKNVIRTIEAHLSEETLNKPIDESNPPDPL
jgi:very-short-patch-repair endonuclease